MIRLVKEWTRPAPRELERQLLLRGGRNHFGEPNFRVVWASGRLEWQGGRWNDFDRHGNRIRSVVAVRRVPRYEPFEGWVVEKWLPPEAYGSRESWRRQFTQAMDGVVVETMGPYPSRGDYEEIFRLARPLTPTVCDAMVAMVLRRGSMIERKLEAEARQAKKERDWNSFVEAVLSDASQAFGGAMFSGHGGKQRHSTVSFCERAGIRTHPF